MPRKKGRSRPTRKRFDADLHMHSTCSDGELTPKQLVAMAKRRNLPAIAITDHDTVSSFAEAAESAAAADIHLIPGTEISAMLHREVHILGLFLEPSHAELNRQLNRQSEARVTRVFEICERLKAEGVDLEPEVVLAEAEGNVGRPHIAKALIKAQVVRNFNEAFDIYLGRKGKAYVPAERLSAEFAINLIHQAGGVAILAHPGVEKLGSPFPELQAMGLDGIEVNHPGHNATMRNSLRTQAQRMDFLVSGGSDMHSHQSSCKLGDLGISRAELEALIEKANQHRNQQDLEEYGYAV